MAPRSHPRAGASSLDVLMKGLGTLRFVQNSLFAVPSANRAPGPRRRVITNQRNKRSLRAALTALEEENQSVKTSAQAWQRGSKFSHSPPGAHEVCDRWGSCLQQLDAHPGAAGGAGSSSPALLCSRCLSSGRGASGIHAVRSVGI